MLPGSTLLTQSLLGRQRSQKEGTPRSWHVRAQLEAMGAQGLIDPSRKAPGLWHLVLFAWNQNGTAKVELSE